jgi:hypothetical protein
MESPEHLGMAPVHVGVMINEQVKLITRKITISIIITLGFTVASIERWLKYVHDFVVIVHARGKSLNDLPPPAPIF